MRVVIVNSSPPRFDVVSVRNLEEFLLLIVSQYFAVSLQFISSRTFLVTDSHCIGLQRRFAVVVS